jgi:hypothetical protein
MRKLSKRRKSPLYRRAGVAALDYMLVLGVILPLAAIILQKAPKIMGLVYEMVSLLVSWPFM